MHRGILSCPADAPLSDAARIMARHRVHAVAVINGDVRRPIGVVSSQDVVAAAARGEDPTARHAATTEPLAISGDEPLVYAAQLMADRGVSHLVVLEPASGYPVGILSTLDVAAVFAGPGSQA
jgi:predicted transcriptional regulator